jgi:O-antigen/teichoic acid export membrane protein
MIPSSSTTPAVDRRARLRMLRLGKEMIWVGAGQAVAVLGGIIGVRWLTELLSPAAYGELALGMTLAALVQQVVLAPPAQAALRYYSSSAESERLADFMAALRGMFGRCTVVYLLFAAVLLPSLWLLDRTRLLPLTLASILFAYLWGAAAVLDSLQNAARHRSIVAWHQGLGQFMRVLLAVALITLLRSSNTITASAAAMSGYVFAAVAVLFSQYFFYRRMLRLIRVLRPMSLGAANPSGSNLAQTAGRMWTYSWPFATWGLFTWAQAVSDRWALQAFGTTADVGLYQPLYLVGYYPVMLLSNFAVQLITPVSFARSGDGSDASRVEASRKLNLSLLLIAAGVTLLLLLTLGLFHGFLFRLLVAREYRSVSVYLPWMVLAGGLFACGQMAALDAMSRGQTQSLILPKVGSAVFGIGINIAGAFYWGLRGIVFANVAFGLIYLASMIRTRGSGRQSETSFP